MISEDSEDTREYAMFNIGAILGYAAGLFCMFVVSFFFLCPARCASWVCGIP